MRSFRSIAPFEAADVAKDGASVLGYALRDTLFVGEWYTLEVLGTDELEAACLEFFVEYRDLQTVRAWCGSRRKVPPPTC